MTVYKDVAGRPNAIDTQQFADPATLPTVALARKQSVSKRPSLASLFNSLIAYAFVALAACVSLTGCKSDQVAQMQIDEMRAEQVAIEDRYVALRNEYEKVRRRLAAQGDPLAKNPGEPSALPLQYPPGASGLDLMQESMFPDSAIEQGPTLHGYPTPGQNVPNQSGPTGPTPTNSHSTPADDADRTIGSVLDNASIQRPMPGNRNVSSRSGIANRSGSSVSRLQLAPVGANVVTLGIDLAQSHGVNRDQIAGDEGVKILVTPLDQQGRLVLEPGDFELALYDYSRNENAEIGKWRFSRDTIRQFLALRGKNTAGIPLQVSLKNYVLRNPEVLAEVRMTRADGQVIQIREIIRVALAENWVQNQAFSLDNLPLPTDAGGLVDFPGNPAPLDLNRQSTSGIVPSYIPRSSTENSVETASETVDPTAWAPERR